ncbi:unnamed protein product [Candidula unifasciata]|uniref:Receptor ligand binding region domain-containing protein n=1 Tax=Candidula unifasciata TaxID=100452 RepID=A0A8S3YD85_9EUPU|nr:unnamed protein product [Candidula unifasciata]
MKINRITRWILPVISIILQTSISTSTVALPKMSDFGMSDEDVCAFPIEESPEVNATEKHTVKIAVIVPYNSSFQFSAQGIVPSICQAKKYLASKKIMSSFQLQFYFGDSKCSDKEGPILAFEFYRQVGVNCFMGPVCDYSLAPVSRYAPYWGIPVISPGGLSHSFGESKLVDYASLTRVGATFDSLTLGLIAFMKQFGWRKVNVIYNSQAKGHQISGFCFLMASAMIHMSKRAMFTGKFVIFMEGRDKPENVLINEIGTEISGKSYDAFFVFFHLRLHVMYHNVQGRGSGGGGRW